MIKVLIVLENLLFSGFVEVSSVVFGVDYVMLIGILV